LNNVPVELGNELFVSVYSVSVCASARTQKAASLQLGNLDNIPVNQILWTCCKAQDGVRPSPDWRRARGRPPTMIWIHQISWDTGIPVTDALELAEDKSFWRQNRNGGMLWLDATCHDDDDDDCVILERKNSGKLFKGKRSGSCPCPSCTTSLVPYPLAVPYSIFHFYVRGNKIE